MSFSAVYKEGFATKFGHSVTVENQKGEWRLYGKEMRPPDFKAGDEVEFEATSKPGRDGKKYWHYTDMRPKGASPSPQGAQQGGQRTFKANNEKLIFITGIVGRAMGSGKFDTVDIEALTIAAREAFRLIDEQAPSEEEIPY